MTTKEKHHAFFDAEIMEAQAKQAVQEQRVFLAGPYIDLSKPKNDPVNVKSTASAARFSVHEALAAKGNSVVLGEHGRLKDLGDAVLGDFNNAVLFERNLIRSKKIDAVVIFPSSPGSFLEFGDWAPDPVIGPKMLVIIDKKYEKDVNYLNLGTALLAADMRAVVSYMPYEEHDKIADLVILFLKKISSIKYRESMYERT